MTKVKKSWMAVVMGALLLGTLVGVVWARPHDRPQTQDITRKVTFTGADFIPSDETPDWNNTGGSIALDTGGHFFHAPVVFPCLPSVTVERIKLHVYDDNGLWLAGACAYVYRANPRIKQDTQLGIICSPGNVGGTSTDPQTYTSTDINKVVWPSQRAYVKLAILGDNVTVYGVTVEYHRNI